MARYLGASCRLCRREGAKLYLKGSKCGTDKCPLNKRPSAPGQHGQGRKKQSEYGLQLREKQKAKRYYGVLERQFRNYFEIANRKQGITGDNLLILLERRLDNVVYRCGLGTSRADARQIVRHSHILVNGKKVNIPSYLISDGDVVSVCEDGMTNARASAIIDVTNGRIVPEWMSFDADKLSCTINRMPTRADVDFDIEEHLIVELYSK